MTILFTPNNNTSMVWTFKDLSERKSREAKET